MWNFNTHSTEMVEEVQGSRNRRFTKQKPPPKIISWPKAFAVQKLWILDLRGPAELGARRLQNELRRHHDCALALPTIHKVLVET